MDLMAIRRGLLMQQQGGLPAAYQQVKYLESSGHQFIYTGVQGKSGVECEANIMWMATGDTSILGARRGSSYRIMLIHQYPNYKWTLGYGASNTGLGSISLNQKYNVKSKLLIGEQSLIIDGVTIYTGTNTTDYTNSFNLSLFACTYESSTNQRMFSSARVYDVIVKSNGITALNYIPCLRISDAVPGMYDGITKSFYTNSGTGQFGYETMDGTVVSPT